MLFKSSVYRIVLLLHLLIITNQVQFNYANQYSYQAGSVDHLIPVYDDLNMYTPVEPRSFPCLQRSQKHARECYTYALNRWANDYGEKRYCCFYLELQECLEWYCTRLELDLERVQFHKMLKNWHGDKCPMYGHRFECWYTAWHVATFSFAAAIPLIVAICLGTICCIRRRDRKAIQRSMASA